MLTTVTRARPITNRISAFGARSWGRLDLWSHVLMNPPPEGEDDVGRADGFALGRRELGPPAGCRLGRTDGVAGVCRWGRSEAGRTEAFGVGRPEPRGPSARSGDGGSEVPPSSFSTSRCWLASRDSTAIQAVPLDSSRRRFITSARYAVRAYNVPGSSSSRSS